MIFIFVHLHKILHTLKKRPKGMKKSVNQGVKLKLKENFQHWNLEHNFNDFLKK